MITSSPTRAVSPAHQPATITQNSDGTAEYDNSQFGFSLADCADLTVSTAASDDGSADHLFHEHHHRQAIPNRHNPYSQIDINVGVFTTHTAYGTNDQGLNLQDVNFMDGDTPEFNFVKTGVQHEVVDMKGQEAWLINILKTWQFN